ncbi:LuxR family transcriptional regulator [Formivibrio citricus]|uniref:LuxR family transcriptional regulator n=1 Tax=Formivibrio citricus TaxID=83765 RepID=A0A1I4YJZ0_9NEIS|nr:LuxR family transcriptional regulator [Formivibrio citricus]SFN37910.1 LuxR family transcriptional regulator [Formivibrio citricus]
MKVWQDSHIQMLLEGESEQALFEHLQTMTRALGFEYCAYGFRVPFPLTNPNIVTFNNYPEAWQLCYQERGYLAVDPTVKHALRSSLPLLWSDDVFGSSRDFWEEARSFGLEIGWAQPYHGPQGTIGLLTLARSSETLGEKELRDKMQKMAWLSQVAHIGMSRCLLPKLMPETGVMLTSREIEVLRWTAEGKTSIEIADILRVSKRTVDFHVNNAIEKLGVNNKTSAAIRAAMLGFLS